MVRTDGLKSRLHVAALASPQRDHESYRLTIPSVDTTPGCETAVMVNLRSAIRCHHSVVGDGESARSVDTAGPAAGVVSTGPSTWSGCVRLPTGRCVATRHWSTSRVIGVRLTCSRHCDRVRRLVVGSADHPALRGRPVDGSKHVRTPCHCEREQACHTCLMCRVSARGRRSLADAATELYPIAYQSTGIEW